MKTNRRNLLGMMATTVVASALVPTATLANVGALDAADFGLLPDLGTDQSAAFDKAIAEASISGRSLFLGAGEYIIANVELSSDVELIGANGKSILRTLSDVPAIVGSDVSNVSIRKVGFAGPGGSSDADHFGLLSFINCTSVTVTDCRFENSAMYGVALYGSSGHISANHFQSHEVGAVFSLDSRGMNINDNFIDDCGNNGILVWRGDQSHDGSIVSGNHISNIHWRNGGNGQNGNGINIYRAGDVVVSNNVITDCAFSAIRANGTKNCQIIGNNCRDLYEVAIFSEFEFDGSIVAQNIIDGTAQGIAITNWNDGGRLAVCANNIVRNVWSKSPNNPDTVPVGIGIEADVVVDGNVVENVPGVGIGVGWGPYMRNVSVTDNIVRKADYGIVVSVVEGVGTAQINSNMIVESSVASIVGATWNDMVETDLQKNASRFPFLSVNDNKY